MCATPVSITCVMEMLNSKSSKSSSHWITGALGCHFTPLHPLLSLSLFLFLPIHPHPLPLSLPLTPLFRHFIIYCMTFRKVAWTLKSKLLAGEILSLTAWFWTGNMSEIVKELNILSRYIQYNRFKSVSETQYRYTQIERLMKKWILMLSLTILLSTTLDLELINTVTRKPDSFPL